VMAHPAAGAERKSSKCVLLKSTSSPSWNLSGWNSSGLSQLAGSLLIAHESTNNLVFVWPCQAPPARLVVSKKDGLKVPFRCCRCYHILNLKLKVVILELRMILSGSLNIQSLFSLAVNSFCHFVYVLTIIINFFSEECKGRN
jgi:hypothetical protein